MGRKAKITKSAQSRFVPYDYITNQAFRIGLEALMHCGDFSVKASLKVYELQDEISKLWNDYEKLRMKLITTHCKKDGEGKPVLNDMKTSYVLDNQELFDKKFTELLEFEVEVPTIPLSLVSEVKLPPKILGVMLKSVLIQDL